VVRVEIRIRVGVRVEIRIRVGVRVEIRIRVGVRGPYGRVQGGGQAGWWGARRPAWCQAAP